jgi:hypothetical protein
MSGFILSLSEAMHKIIANSLKWPAPMPVGWNLKVG